MGEEKVRGKAFGAVKRFKGSIGLAVLLAASYFFFSSGGLFIGKCTLLSLSFSLSQPWNLLLHMLGHISLHHLAANLAMAALFALVVEAALASFDVFALFFFSGALTAMVFSLLNPGTGLVGASGGGTAMMASALLLDLRKGLAVLALVAMLFFFLPGAIAFLQEAEQESIEEKAERLEERIEEAVESGERGKAERLAVEKQEVERSLESFKESRVFAVETRADLPTHVMAAFMGLLYLVVFRRKKLRAALQRNAFIFRKN